MIEQDYVCSYDCPCRPGECRAFSMAFRQHMSAAWWAPVAVAIAFVALAFIFG